LRDGRAGRAGQLQSRYDECFGDSLNFMSPLAISYIAFAAAGVLPPSAAVSDLSVMTSRHQTQNNTVFGSKCSAICAQAVYLMHSTRPSVT